MPINSERYFNEIKAVWLALAGTRRVIPFWTPLIEKPKALIIGMNHSEDFVKGNARESREVSERLAVSMPSEPEVRHEFAMRVLEVIRLAGIEIGSEWMGTNRCAIQTESGGVEVLESLDGFTERQKDMDAILKRLVHETAPRNVILVTEYACGLYYPRVCESTWTIRDEKIKDIEPDGQKVRVIPIPLPFRPKHKEFAIERLRKSFVQE